VMDRAERLRECRVDEKLRDWVGNMRSDCVKGRAMFGGAL
jgi:hypothetical protein